MTNPSVDAIRISPKAYDSLRGFCIAFMGAMMSSWSVGHSSVDQFMSLVSLLLMLTGLAACVLRGLLAWRERIVWWWVGPASLYSIALIVSLLADLIGLASR